MKPRGTFYHHIWPNMHTACKASFENSVDPDQLASHEAI